MSLYGELTAGGDYPIVPRTGPAAERRPPVHSPIPPRYFLDCGPGTWTSAPLPAAQLPTGSLAQWWATEPGRRCFPQERWKDDGPRFINSALVVVAFSCPIPLFFFLLLESKTRFFHFSQSSPSVCYHISHIFCIIRTKHTARQR